MVLLFLVVFLFIMIVLMVPISFLLTFGIGCIVFFLIECW